MALEPSKKLAEAMDARGTQNEKILQRLKPEIEFRTHFLSKQVAANFEYHAAKGDPYALERLYHQYMDFSVDRFFAPINSLLGAILAMHYFVDTKTLNATEAAQIATQLTGTAVTATPDDFLLSGRRMPYPSKTTDELTGSMLPVEGVLDYLANYGQYSYRPRIRPEDNLTGIFSTIGISRPHLKPQLVKTYLTSLVDRDVNFMTTLAGAGNIYAAHLLAKFYAIPTIKYHDGFFEFNTSTITNSHYDRAKAKYCSDVEKLLSGKCEWPYQSDEQQSRKEGERIYREYTESRMNSATGTYDVAEAIINNPFVRWEYNKQQGTVQNSSLSGWSLSSEKRNITKNPIDGALELLKKSVELGNPNAAWRLARHYHEDYITTDNPQSVEQAYAWYAKAHEMGHKEAHLTLDYFKSRLPNLPAESKAWTKAVPPKSLSPDGSHIQERPGHRRESDF